MIDRVVTVLKDVADEVVLPRFQRLTAGDVTEKSPGDLVTVADREAELALGVRLAGLLPGSLVVGEEAVAADHRVLERIGDPGPVWVIDPIDGTGNFAAGEQPFAIMVALLRGGVPALGVIYEPMPGTIVVAESGGGAYLDGVRMTLNGELLKTDQLRGAVHTRYLPETLRDQVERRKPRLGAALPGWHCAGHDYPELLRGNQHFMLYWRSLPWDHAPGALMVREAGGVVRHFDGTEYDPTQPRYGLLVCRDEAVFDLARSALLA